MAKDGTIRGGARAGAGKKRKSMGEKIADGQMELPKENLPRTAAKPKKHKPNKFLTEEQKPGKNQYIKETFKKVWDWLDSRGITERVAPHIIDEYVMLITIHLACEKEILEKGRVLESPKGVKNLNPLVRASIDYVKQANNLWYGAIGAVARDVVPVTYDGDDMERLLTEARMM